MSSKLKDDPVNMSTTSAQTNTRPKRHRPSSPVPSCVSMKSEESMGNPPEFSKEPAPSHIKPKRDRPSSPVPSCVSMKSEESMGNPPEFSKERLKLKADLTQDQFRCRVCEQVLRDPIITITCGHSFCRQCIGSYWEQPGPPEDQACPQCDKKYTTEPPVDEHLSGSSRHLQGERIQVSGKKSDQENLRRVKENHKTSLKRRFENISEDHKKPGIHTPLNEIYTELYITEGGSEGVNKEHEVWQVELASRAQSTEDTPINCNDIFKPLPGQEKHIRTVLTKGVAGIGKTVSVQKFILDWVDGIANKNIDFIFPLSFRELNLVRNDRSCLHKLLLNFHPELKELNGGEGYKDCQVVFIFDGLDESRMKLNMEQNINLYDVKQASSVDTLMKSLIQGTLFSSAFIWITSRPAAATQIPAQCINRITEVRGFNDPQREEYFRKRINDKNKANRIISHIKASRSLHIMCHIPVFCWIAATVLHQMLEQDNSQEIPKTLTEMFIHFLLIQTTRKDQKYQSGKQRKQEQLQQSHDMILRLAKLAFKSLKNGNVMFYEEDLIECGIDVSEASVYSGLCTEVFKAELLFHHKRVYCFVHLSIQEFLAALHVFVSYSNQMENLENFFCLEESLKLVVTKVLENRNGHMDLLLRFLMGISVEKNQRLLHSLLTHIHNSSDSIKKVCQHIKELSKEDLSPERCISLLQCLSEVGDNSIHEEIQHYLESPKSFKKELSSAHCSALAHMLLMSEEVLDEFDLKKYNTSDEGHRRLIPAVRCCRKAQLDGCKLNKLSCETVKRCLQSANSLIQLDLTRNALGDSGVHILSAGLTNPHCKLQILRLADCKFTEKSCEILATVLQSSNCLIDLDLSHNDLRDSGVQSLSKGLSSPDCKLETLRLSGCLISEEGCGFLASALTSNPSHLKELDLSYNHPGESGLKLLYAKLRDSVSKLEILNVDHCGEIRLRPGVQKYACELSLDPNTAQRDLSLSEGNRKVTRLSEEQSYPDHPERFDWWAQVLCREGLSGRCYWEAEWSGQEALMAVAYKSIDRKARSEEGRLGFNAKSWSLICSPDKYSVWHNNKSIDIPSPSPGARRVGVYLDWLAGTLSFYSVSSDTLTHLHTFHSTFTESLYPGFWIWEVRASMSLCKMT